MLMMCDLIIMTILQPTIAFTVTKYQGLRSPYISKVSRACVRLLYPLYKSTVYFFQILFLHLLYTAAFRSL